VWNSSFSFAWKILKLNKRNLTARINYKDVRSEEEL